LNKWGRDDAMDIASLYEKIVGDKLEKKDNRASSYREEDDDDDNFTPVSREDKLFESFAKEAMRELVAHNIADFVLLKNDKLRKWWQDVVKQERIEQERRERIEHRRQLKEQALAKLSDEEKEALGLIRKKR